MSKSALREHPCIYCGSEHDLAPDHVPPKALFAPPRPSHLLTVPSCRRCNQEFGFDDEFFRNMLVLRREVSQHPASGDLLETVFRSLERPQARGLAARVFQSIRDFELRTPSGLYAGQAPGYVIEGERLERILKRYARALMFAETRQVLSAPVRLVVDYSFEDSEERRRKVLAMLGDRPNKTFGRKEFQYRWVQAEDSPFATLWLMAFYGVTPFVCLTIPPYREFGIAAPAG